MASSFGSNSWRVSSVEELMALAEAQERQAAARYDQLAARMDRLGSPETAALFRRLAAMERDHVEALSDWAGTTSPQGKLPDHSGEGSVADTDDIPASLTPYRALAIAVRNEERAFSLLTYVAANADRTDVRKRAEALALEELRHVALLRAERRRAFHAERHAGHGREYDVEASIGSIEGLRDVARKLLSRALETHKGIVHALRDADAQDEADLLFRLMSEEGAEIDRLGGRVVHGSNAETIDGQGKTAPPGLLARAMRPVEDMVDIFLAAAERSRDEEVVREAQRLGGVTITWLTDLHAGLDRAD